jgi:hypothetical protein
MSRIGTFSGRNSTCILDVIETFGKQSLSISATEVRDKLGGYMKLLTVLAAATALTVAVPAQAAEFLFSFTSNFGNASGTFTTAGAASATPTLVTAMTGTMGGNAITLLAPGAYPTGAPNDNLFSTAAPYFSFSGLSFAANGLNYNLYSQGGVRLCGQTVGCQNAAQFSGLTVSEVTSPVPEPATWAMMLLGFGLVGYVMRSRRQRNSVTYA